MTDSTSVEFTSDIDHLRIDHYVPNALWDLVDFNVQSINTTDRYIFFYDNDEQNQTILQNVDTSFSVVLKRKPLYFMMNSIFPTLILNCITIFSYALPFSIQISLCNKRFLLKYNHTRLITQLCNKSNIEVHELMTKSLITSVIWLARVLYIKFWV